ncbi:hypothetical protein POM88_014851 [Heracleum sosnowskyi]|uniref:Uncharacterized protein n=1 Tax=Heracleum sosnowskyi TaxID=360622 RepID=A0AAD8MWW4_9APIA|nr:hypothetical protein POM88_014851 [Heracleum sosnowskyi]
MVEIIEIIGEFDIEKIIDLEYSEEVEKVWIHFPPSENNENVRRTKTHEDCIRKKIDEYFFLKFKSKGSEDGILGESSGGKTNKEGDAEQGEQQEDQPPNPVPRLEVRVGRPHKCHKLPS